MSSATAASPAPWLARIMTQRCQLASSHCIKTASRIITGGQRLIILLVTLVSLVTRSPNWRGTGALIQTTDCIQYLATVSGPGHPVSCCGEASWWQNLTVTSVSAVLLLTLLIVTGENMESSKQSKNNHYSLHRTLVHINHTIQNNFHLFHSHEPSGLRHQWQIGIPHYVIFICVWV